CQTAPLPPAVRCPAVRPSRSCHVYEPGPPSGQAGRRERRQTRGGYSAMAAPDMIADPSRRWPIDRPRAVAVAAGCGACFAVILWLTVSGRSALFDVWGLLVWRDADLRPGGPEFLLEAARDVTALGGVLLRNLIALGAVVALLFLRMPRQALWLTLTVLLGWLAGSTLKAVVGRAR